MAKKKTKQILRITLIVAAISSLYFVPWLLVKAWIMPLPNTVQEQIDEAIGYGFDGMVVYIKQGNKPPQYYTGGWHNKATKTKRVAYTTNTRRQVVHTTYILQHCSGLFDFIHVI